MKFQVGSIYSFQFIDKKITRMQSVLHIKIHHYLNIIIHIWLRRIKSMLQVMISKMSRILWKSLSILRLITWIYIIIYITLQRIFPMTILVKSMKSFKTTRNWSLFCLVHLKKLSSIISNMTKLNSQRINVFINWSWMEHFIWKMTQMGVGQMKTWVILKNLHMQTKCFKYISINMYLIHFSNH